MVEPLMLCVEKIGVTVDDFVFDVNVTGSATGTDYLHVWSIVLHV